MTFKLDKIVKNRDRTSILVYYQNDDGNIRYVIANSDKRLLYIPWLNKNQYKSLSDLIRCELVIVLFE